MTIKNFLITIASLHAIAAVHAAPTVASGTITTDCVNVRLQGLWLVADCWTGQDKTTRIQSTVFLPPKITNREGNLEWKVQGAYPRYCTECKLIEISKLNCKCRPSGGPSKVSTIDLSDHIRNYNGHLRSDLAGPVTIPSNSSTVKIPENIRWGLSVGGTSCYSPDPEACKSFPDPPVTDLTCPANDYTYSTDGAPTCSSKVVPIHGPIYEQFRSLRVNGNERAWDFVVYDNPDCKGPDVGRVDNSEWGKCKVFPKSMLGVNVIPLWNADTT
ncbi:Cyanovirin-N [Dendryphion nanum]|uniref:Cyanovirin-N n=1 Tax=Dendryphion nanum TaxID=256645 RepID=A0A9P9DN30_9PLEO|nr:Cyanovirin-N [Dendryphion nanum]